MIENAITPRWIRLRVLPISKYPSGENAACHFLALSVLPAWIINKNKFKFKPLYTSVTTIIVHHLIKVDPFNIFLSFKFPQ